MLPTPDPAWPRRLAAYWAARDRFIESGRDVRPSPRVEDMLAQVREPLLSVLRISPDFRPAYDPLLSMATALARSDVSGARTLLTELTRIQPARTEASRAAGADGRRSVHRRRHSALSRRSVALLGSIRKSEALFVFRSRRRDRCRDRSAVFAQLSPGLPLADPVRCGRTSPYRRRSEKKR